MRKNLNTSSQGSTSASTTKYANQNLGVQQQMTQLPPKVQLTIRNELFDHGVFPQMHGTITPAILIDTFTNLNLLSSIDYKIKLNSWVDQATKHIPGMTEADATVYFLIYQNLLSDIDGPGANQPNPGSSNGFSKASSEALNTYSVDVRCFGLFLALQLYS